MSTSYSLDDENETQLGTKYSKGKGNGMGLQMAMTEEEWQDVMDLRVAVYSERNEKFASPRWWMRQMVQDTNNQIEYQTADSIKKDIDYYNNHRFGVIFNRHKETLRKKLARKMKHDSPKPKN